MIPIFGVLLSTIALVQYLCRKAGVPAVAKVTLVPLAAAVLLVFADNLLRAGAALIAVDERIRVRRFGSFRVFWRLVKVLPVLAVTQAISAFSFGPGWLIADCLWPVVCIVEKLRGKRAVLRSRSLMAGLNSAGRALAIRHLALASLAIGDLVESLSFHMRTGHAAPSNSTTWFPIFAVFAAAPLYLYDRTAAREEGPLLQLDRTPEIRVTSRPLSVSSMVWLVIGILYLIYEPVKLWLSGSK